MDRTAATQTRRQFLSRAAAGLGGGLLAASAAPHAACASPAGSQERKLGVALVGLGNYATGQLAPALQATERCTLAGIVTGTPSKAEEWKTQYGLPDENVYSYETFDRIADNPAIDVVYVVLPNAMHAEYTIRAAQAGKHVICEKPMAVSVAEAEAMIAACEEAGRALGIGYRLHYEPHHQRVMEIGQEQLYGPARYLQAGLGFRLGNPNQWRLDYALAGGGALMDVGVYAVQAARYTTGEEPTRVTAQEVKTDPDKFAEVDETMLFQLVFPSGAVADCSASYNASFNRLYLSAEEGWAELRPSYSYGGIRGETHEGPMNLDNVPQQARQMDAFAATVLDGAPLSASGEDGLRDMRILEAIYEAVRTGEAVNIRS